jgi:hypothetical protein
MNEVLIWMLERVLILMMMLNRERMYDVKMNGVRMNGMLTLMLEALLILETVYLNSLLKYCMADCLHMMEIYFQTPSRLAFVAAAAAIQML